MNKVTTAILTVNIGSDAKAIKRAIDEIRKVCCSHVLPLRVHDHREHQTDDDDLMLCFSLIYSSRLFRCQPICPSCASALMQRSWLCSPTQQTQLSLLRKAEEALEPTSGSHAPSRYLYTPYRHPCLKWLLHLSSTHESHRASSFRPLFAVFLLSDISLHFPSHQSDILYN